MLLPLPAVHLGIRTAVTRRSRLQILILGMKWRLSGWSLLTTVTHNILDVVDDVVPDQTNSVFSCVWQVDSIITLPELPRSMTVEENSR